MCEEKLCIIVFWQLCLQTLCTVECNDIVIFGAASLCHSSSHMLPVLFVNYAAHSLTTRVCSTPAGGSHAGCLSPAWKSACQESPAALRT